jgi:anti-sigma factor ChrR (cupin superfamily)
MRLRDDFTQRAVVRPGDAPWVPSPAAGVERLMLDRIGDEVARATSLVRYAPRSHFPAHTHGGGEEFLVLEGEFADDSGRYPVGFYVRNPVASRHTPFTDTGCTIFVKLWQFDPADQAHVVIDTRRAMWDAGDVGVATLPLHHYGSERVWLERWAEGTRRPAHAHQGGEEILVLDGSFEDEEGVYPAGTWIRNPPGSRHAAVTYGGCVLYVKTGHLFPGPASNAHDDTHR